MLQLLRLVFQKLSSIYQLFPLNIPRYLLDVTGHHDNSCELCSRLLDITCYKAWCEYWLFVGLFDGTAVVECGEVGICIPVNHTYVTILLIFLTDCPKLICSRCWIEFQ